MYGIYLSIPKDLYLSCVLMFVCELLCMCKYLCLCIYSSIRHIFSWLLVIFISLSRAVVPTIQGYEDAGDFNMKERLKTSIRQNLVFYLCVGSIGFFGLILLIIMRRNWFVSHLFLYLFLSIYFL